MNRDYVVYCIKTPNIALTKGKSKTKELSNNNALLIYDEQPSNSLAMMFFFCLLLQMVIIDHETTFGNVLFYVKT